MLLIRILTALILIPLTVVVLIYLPPLSFRYLTTFIVFGAAWEWGRLIGLSTKRHCLVYASVVVVMCFFALSVTDVNVLAAGCIWWCLSILMIVFFPKDISSWNNIQLEKGMMGLLVLVPCWIAINFIRQQSDGLYALLFLFVLIWGADSAAYFVGKICGKHLLAPRVSPGKTWEGCIGGILFSSVIAAVALKLGDVPFKLWPWAFLLSWITIIFSIVGDLFESVIKRLAGVKDSGNILPGHGGLLDRIDSLTAAAPVYAFGAWVLGTYINN